MKKILSSIKELVTDAEAMLSIATVVGIFTAIAVPIAAWITHVIVSIKTASWVLLVVGSIVFPVGIIHGIASWFGIV